MILLLVIKIGIKMLYFIMYAYWETASLCRYPIPAWSCDECCDIDCIHGGCHVTQGGIPECFCDMGWEGTNCNISVFDRIHGMLDILRFCSSFRYYAPSGVCSKYRVYILPLPFFLSHMFT